MGCFNVSCGISGISIFGDSMVLLPLVPTRFPAPLTSAHLVENDPGCALFQPFCLPLFGNHDTYGRLENIERNWHVEVIEAAYHLSIDQFAEHFTTLHEAEKRPALPPDACGMYVHRRMWEVFSHPTYDEWGAPMPRTEPEEGWQAVWWMRQAPAWQTLYSPTKGMPPYRSLLTDLCTLLGNMAALNRMLMPTVNGYQHGNYYAERLLHTTALTILNRYIAEDEDGEDGEEGKEG